MFIFQQIYLPYNLFQYVNNILDAVMGPNFVPYASSVKTALGTWKGEDLGLLLKEFLAISMMSLSTSVLEKSAFPSLLCNIKIGESQIAGLHHTFYYLTRLMSVIKFSLNHES